MTAIDRLAKRLEGLDIAGRTLHERQAHVVACFIYDHYLPSQVIGMKAAAELLNLPTSNTLTMRLARGHDLLIVAKIDGNRITTVDAVEAYGEIHAAPAASGDDGSEQRSAS